MAEHRLTHPVVVGCQWQRHWRAGNALRSICPASACVATRPEYSSQKMASNGVRSGKRTSMNFSFVILSARRHYPGGSCAENTRHARPLKHEKVQRCPLAGTDTDVFPFVKKSPCIPHYSGAWIVLPIWILFPHHRPCCTRKAVRSLMPSSAIAAGYLATLDCHMLAEYLAGLLMDDPAPAIVLTGRAGAIGTSRPSCARLIGAPRKKRMD